METSGTNVCSQCKCRSSKKWHTVPAMDGNPATTLCNDCSSSASDLAQLKSGEAVDNSTESVASEELKYEVEFFSHQEEESQSNPAIDMDIVADEPGQSTSTAPKKGGKKRKGKRGGFRGVQSQAAGVVGKGKSRRSIFKQVVSIKLDMIDGFDSNVLAGVSSSDCVRNSSNIDILLVQGNTFSSW